jgi:MFS family permease
MRPLTRLSTSALFAYTSYAMCRVPILPLYAQSLGAGPATVGWVMAMSTLTGVVLKAPAGAVSDLVGRGRVLVVAALVFAALPFAYLAAGSLAALMVIRAVHGSATALFGPVAAAAVSDLAPRQERGRALGLYSAVQGAGQAAGAALAGTLASLGLPTVFVASGVLGSIALTGVSISRWPDAPRIERRGGAAVFEGVSRAARDPALLLVSALQAGLMTVSGATGAFLPLFARDTLTLPTRLIGLVIAAQVAATLVTRPLAGSVSDRIGRARVVQIGLLVVAAGAALVATAPGAWRLLAGSMLLGAGVALAGAAASALVTDLSQRSGYGAAHGVFGTIYDVGDAAGPIIAGLVVTMAGYRSLFVVAAAWAVALGMAARRVGQVGKANAHPTDIAG